MEILAGTSGFAYKEWKGPFYPTDLADDGMLAYYGERLPAVEINNTFYRMPKRSVLTSWAEQVPPAFRFSIKASRRITHFGRLKGVESETQFLLDNLAVLGPRLGTVLFQLPPNLKADRERLETFLATLPEGLAAAFEFRHPSWLDDPSTAELLAARGLAIVVAETEEEPPPDPLPVTAPWGYLRLRRQDYEEADLARWVERLRATDWERAFVVFKHEDAGAGPRLAARFLELARG